MVFFLKPIRYLIHVQERRRYSFKILFFFAIFVGLGRALQEMLFFKVPLKNSEILTFIPFYLSLGYLLTLILSLSGSLPWRKVNLAVVIGIFLGLFPPVLDLLLSERSSVFYGYYFLWNLNQLPWLGYKPELNFPLGEAITIWASIAFCGIYIAIKTGSLWRTLLSLILAYSVFIFAGSLLPMLVFRIKYGLLESMQSSGRIDSVMMRPVIYYLAVAQMMVMFVCYLTLNISLLKHILKRLPHTFPFIAICALGGSYANAELIDIVLICFAVMLAGLGTLVQNDWFDRHEDSRISVVSAEDVFAFNSIFFLIIVFLFMLNIRAVIPLLLAYATSFLYNYPFYRARNSFPGNLKIEGIWGGSVFVSGLLLMKIQDITDGQLLAAFLVFGGWSLVAAIKDAKDVQTDSKNNVKTLYTIFMSRAVPFQKIHFFVRIAVVIAFLIPPIILLLSTPIWYAAIAFLLGPLSIFFITRKADTNAFLGLLSSSALFILYFVLLAQLDIFRI
ncbi:MAG: UbiA family prenyltransferase [Leptospiraceae bacterium]|nr:UbiA family prenyltransferase [Leptospiraceae bacterium]